MALYDPESLDRMPTVSGVFGDQIKTESLYGDLASVDVFEKEGVVIHEFEPDFEFLETQTVCNLLNLRIPPIREGLVINQFSAVLKAIRSLGVGPNRYANPGCLLVSSKVDASFLSLVYSYRSRWKERVKDCLGTQYPYMVGATKGERNLMKQLVVSGVLLIEYKHCPPGQWPRRRPAIAIEAQFGRLKVLRVFLNQKCECICTCGKKTVVRKGHLLSGKTKSCGCLKAEHEERVRRRK